LADRLDTLTGLFAAGLAPSGNKDPFAQRRAALGLVQNLISAVLDLDLRQAAAMAAAQQPIPLSDENRAAVLTFIIERLRNLFLEQGFRYDVVEAVVVEQGMIPARAARAAAELSRWVSRPDWNAILPAYARCVRITRSLGERFDVLPESFIEPAEKALYAALQTAESASHRPGSVDDFLNAFLPMIPAINKFFDDVLVMAEDELVRRNRLGLVQRIAALANGAADLSRLEGF
jgi:glycyl-tRNA synthetase